MEAELFIEKLFTEEMYLMPECGNYIYHSVPDKPFGWKVWRKTIGQGNEQLYNWKEDVGPGCWCGSSDDEISGHKRTLQ